MRTKRSLDFVVIGAQKSATTSLHHYLSKHPEILLPIEKEAPFFSRSDVFNRGYDWYINAVFPNTSSGRLIGTVTPQYMAYPGVAERIWNYCPEAKLIAILRDPIDRARSHHAMRARAFGECITLQQAIAEQIRPEALSESRVDPTPSNSFVTWGEYGRILTDYLKYFDRSQLLIIFQRDLANQPESTLHLVYQFLGLGSIPIPSNQKRFNSSEVRLRSPITVLIANAIYRTKTKDSVKRFIPDRLKRRLRFWSIVNRNVSNAPVDNSLTDELLAKLAQHYLDDMRLLKEIIGIEPPWRETLECYCTAGNVPAVGPEL